jgi:hypothetical protein
MCATPSKDDSASNHVVGTLKIEDEDMANHAVTRLPKMHTYVSVFSLLCVILAFLIPSYSGSVLKDTVASMAEPATTTISISTKTKTTDTSSQEEEIEAPRRGKLIGSNFHARDLYDAYKEIQLEYHQKALGAGANDWKILSRKEGVEISMMEHASDPTCPYVRMTVVIPTPVEDCWEFLQLANWDDSMPQMDPFYEGVSLHGEFTHRHVHMILARKRTQRILAFGKRDFVFLSVSSDQPMKDGTWVSGSVSVQTPKIPRQPGYTRAYQDSIAFYKPLEDNTKTRVTIVCRIDLNDSTDGGSGGLLPMWLYVKTIGATGARSFISMRNVLEQQAAEKKRTQKLLLLLEEEGDEVMTTKTRVVPGLWKRILLVLARTPKMMKADDGIPPPFAGKALLGGKLPSWSRRTFTLPGRTLFQRLFSKSNSRDGER